MGDCIAYYLDTPDAGLWRTLDAVPESLPDQGRDRQDGGGDDEERKSKRQREDPPLPPPPDDQPGWQEAEGKGK